MPTSVTPVLSASSGYEQDVPSQVAALVRWFVYNPGGTSDLWEADLISFRTLAARHEDNREYLASESARVLQNTLNNKFKNLNFTCEFTASDYQDDTPDGRYRIKMDISYADGSGTVGIPGLVTGLITVNPNTYDIRVNFRRDI